MKLVTYAATLAIALTGVASSANAVGCLSGAAAGAVAGHFVRTGPNHHRHTMMGAAAGCVAGHEMKMHEKRVAKQRAAAAAAGQPVPAHH
jgi:outer membrane lipoprotein SlyB